MPAADYSKRQRGDGHGRPIGNGRLTYVVGNRAIEDLDPVSRKILDTGSGTSIFDPVLCELIYRWFCPQYGQVLDPFAGGSVRGIVASLLGYSYTGYDLSAQQIESNEEQANRICKEPMPKWICADGATVKGKCDLMFSCPPYGDLERYSDDPRDLSTMPHPEFAKSYREIIKNCAALLKPNRFACFVVGDYRDSKGFYRNFVSDTIAAFQSCGCILYNEAILITAVGSLPIRAGRAFASGRKLGKTHQNVLVFFNGDPSTIKSWKLPEFGELEDDLPELPA